MAVLEQRSVGEDGFGARVQGRTPGRAVVVLSDTQDPEPGPSRQPHGRDPVIRPGREVDHGMCRPAAGRSGGQVGADDGGTRSVFAYGAGNRARP